MVQVQYTFGERSIKGTVLLQNKTAGYQPAVLFYSGAHCGTSVKNYFTNR